jgi:hypothetical protein
MIVEGYSRTGVDHKRRRMCRKALRCGGDIDDTVDAFKTDDIAMGDEGETRREPELAVSSEECVERRWRCGRDVNGYWGRGY